MDISFNSVARTHSCRQCSLPPRDLWPESLAVFSNHDNMYCISYISVSTNIQTYWLGAMQLPQQPFNENGHPWFWYPNTCEEIPMGYLRFDAGVSTSYKCLVLSVTPSTKWTYYSCDWTAAPVCELRLT